MTLSPDFRDVTFWDCCNHHEKVLQHRILPNEVENLKTYLSPKEDNGDAENNKSEKELQQIAAIFKRI
jgi:hypothetical protein